MKKFLIGGVSVAALAGGSIALATLSPIQLAGARNATPAVQVQAGQDPGTTQPSQDRGKGHGWGRDGGPGRLDKALDELVKDGTITQDQADKIKEKLRSSMGQGVPPGVIKAGLKQAAASIGITEDQLIGELKSGKTVAEVAQAHGVDPQKVINDLVGFATAKIDEAVAAGKLSADRANEIKSTLVERITEMVNSKHHPKGPHGRRDGKKNKPDQPSVPEGPDGQDGSETQSGPSTSAAPDATTVPSAPAQPTTEAPRQSPSTGGSPSGAPGTTAG